MKKLLTASVVALAAIAFAAPVLAQTPAPTEVPFPAPKADVFVAGWTFTAPGHSLGTGVQTNSFPRGTSVVFRAFAADLKAGKVLTDQDVKYFYVQIPGQPNLKLAFGQVGTRWLWTGTWTIPADYTPGVVQFRVLVKTKAKKYGSFQQAPVASAQLTVT